MSVRKRYVRQRNIQGELTVAIEMSNTHNTEALLAEGANPNFKYDRQPLIFHATPPNLRVLLENKAMVDQPDDDGMTALAFFCNEHRRNNDSYNNKEGNIRILLEKHADPNLADKNGLTPLHYLMKGSLDPVILRLLIDKGADVNQVDNEENTALHMLGLNREIFADQAFPYPYEEAIQILLGAGANPLLKNEEGYTASEVAVQNNANVRLIRLLKQAERNAGANVNVPELPVNAPQNANANAANAAARGQLRNQILAMGNAQNLFNNIPIANVAPAPAPHNNNANMRIMGHHPREIRNIGPAEGGRRKNRKSRKGKKARKTRKGHKGHKARKGRKTRRH